MTPAEVIARLQEKRDLIDKRSNGELTSELALYDEAIRLLRTVKPERKRGKIQAIDARH